MKKVKTPAKTPVTTERVTCTRFPTLSRTRPEKRPARLRINRSKSTCTLQEGAVPLSESASLPSSARSDSATGMPRWENHSSVSCAIF
jgi:hypothetical protein